MKVLIVEDESAIRFILANRLSQKGLEVHQASHAKMALEQLATTHFDVVITDIQMPGLDGVSLIKEMRRRSGNGPVIYVFSGDVWGREEELMKLGVKEVFYKPDGWQALIAAISSLL